MIFSRAPGKYLDIPVVVSSRVKLKSEAASLWTIAKSVLNVARAGVAIARRVMNIGQAASASGVTPKMIRYYESISLVPEAGRTNGGYRVYGQDDVRVLRFIHQARTLGFPTEQIRQLLGLWQDRDRASAEVKKIALQHIAELDMRIAELIEMRSALGYLASHCAGDDRPACPILESIDGGQETRRLARRPGAYSGAIGGLDSRT